MPTPCPLLKLSTTPFGVRRLDAAFPPARLDAPSPRQPLSPSPEFGPFQPGQPQGGVKPPHSKSAPLSSTSHLSLRTYHSPSPSPAAPSCPLPSNKQDLFTRPELPKTSNNEAPHPHLSFIISHLSFLDLAPTAPRAKTSLIAPYRPLSSNKQAISPKLCFDAMSNRISRKGRFRNHALTPSRVRQTGRTGVRRSQERPG
jgi:hypothetical protein